MAGELWEYLNTATADYTATQFDVSPQHVVVTSGFFKQDVVEFDDDSVVVITHSTKVKSFFYLAWEGLSDADAATIFDFYFDTAKGYGKSRTFEFPNPEDDVTYIVRFDCEISKEKMYSVAIPEITLRVHGYKAF